MKKIDFLKKPATALIMFAVAFTACSDDDSKNVTPDDVTLHAAFDDFDADHYSIYIDGDEVVIETDGLPNHTSPYWSETHELYVEPTVADGLAPGHIDDFNGSYTLRVPASPSKAAGTSATGLGPIWACSKRFSDLQRSGRAKCATG